MTAVPDTGVFAAHPATPKPARRHRLRLANDKPSRITAIALGGAAAAITGDIELVGAARRPDRPLRRHSAVTSEF